jgi:hypothetical protein
MGYSTDYSIKVGFRLSFQEAFGSFEKTIPEVSHMEKRFDPKTGERLEDVKVVERKECTSYIIEHKGKAYPCDNWHELCRTLTSLIPGCSVDMMGSQWLGEKDNYYVFSVPMLEEIDTGDGIHCSGSYSLSSILDEQLIQNLNSLKYQMRQLGIEPGEAEIILHHICL